MTVLKIILLGNCGQDPETRTFDDGGSVTNISVAHTEKWKNKQTGEPQERTEWVRVVFKGRLAEIAAQYLHKGSKIYAEGTLVTRKYQDKQTGQDRYSTEMVAHQLQMLDSRSDSQGGQQPQQQQQNQSQQQPQQNNQQQNYQQQPRQQQNYQQQPAQQNNQPAQQNNQPAQQQNNQQQQNQGTGNADPFLDDDMDIPF